jgi:hypothetical protein
MDIPFREAVSDTEFSPALLSNGKIPVQLRRGK